MCLLSAVLTIMHKRMHYSFKMAINSVKIDEMKRNFTRCSVENFSFIVHLPRALFLNKILTTVSNP